MIAKIEGDTLSESYRHGERFIRSEDELKKRWKSYLFGYPITHSLAPKLHECLFSGAAVPWTYDLVESKDRNDFLPKLQAQDCIGAAVTMPHKVSIIHSPAIQEVTEEARVIGACNTIFKRRGSNGAVKYIGTNTDCIGVRESFLQNHPCMLERCSGRPALVIGGGGACRSAVYALWKWMGASNIYINCRLKSEVDGIIQDFERNPEFTGQLLYVETVEQARALETPVLAVGTIPDQSPVEPNEVQARRVTMEFLQREEKGVCLEMCYHPSPVTELYRLLKQNRWEVIPGTEALIYQGLAQQVLWLEKPMEFFNVKEAEMLIRKEVGKH